MKKTVKYILLFCFFINIASAQSVQQLIQNGDNAYETYNYFSAIDFYEETLKQNNSLIDVQFRLAESYRQVFNYPKAEKYYLTIAKNDPDNKYPESMFYAGMMMKSNGKYQEAIEVFHKYINGKTKNNVLVSSDRAKMEILACEQAIELKNKPMQVEVQNLKAINSPYSEFNPVPIKNKGLIFSALKPVSQSFNAILQSNEHNTNIYISYYGMQGLQNPNLFDANINSKNQHTANITFSHDSTQVYFNRCVYKNYKLKCDIWTSNLQENKMWSKATKLSEKINSENYTSTQPYLVFDKKTENNILYFVSDRPGGIGGMDIWYSIIVKGEPQSPINLGSIINTPGDEITPYYDNETLYFSSDWHKGLGGFDIFKSKGGLSAWEEVQNIGYPINSEANDFYFIKEDDEVAYLVSNRIGSMAFKNENCCNDIYIVDFEPEIPKDIIVATQDSIVPTIQQDILELLPLPLYFDNDHPNPKTMLSETKLTYQETVLNYVKEKETFIAEYISGLSEDKKLKARKEMEMFFANEIEAGMQKLEILCNLIYQDLQYGSQISIKVKGFASPLTTAEYNYLLTKRRISSLINYFKTYENGILLPYLEHNAENGGSLTIIEEAAGEALANPYVSDNPLDRKQSVYSIAASKERRIEIFIYESSIDYINVDTDKAMIRISDNLVQLYDFIGIENKTITINISNVGKEELIIDKIISSNENIEVKSYPQTLKAGEQGMLIFTIKGSILPAYNQHIVIYSNSLEKRNVVYISSYKN